MITSVDLQSSRRFVGLKQLQPRPQGVVCCLYSCRTSALCEWVWVHVYGTETPSPHSKQEAKKN